MDSSDLCSIQLSDDGRLLDEAASSTVDEGQYMYVSTFIVSIKRNKIFPAEEVLQSKKM